MRQDKLLKAIVLSFNFAEPASNKININYKKNLKWKLKIKLNLLGFQANYYR